MDITRRPIREVNLKRRYGAMSTGEVMHEQLCLLCAAVLLMVGTEEEHEHAREELELCAALITLQVETVRVDQTVIPTVRGRDLCIADIPEDRAWGDYRFRRADLYRLLTVLRFPAVWECKNRSRFAGETALLLMLRRLRYAQAGVAYNSPTS